MQQHDYDKVLYRLMSILGRLNDGEILYKDELAKEFNVSTKTIRKNSLRIFRTSSLKIRHLMGMIQNAEVDDF